MHYFLLSGVIRKPFSCRGYLLILPETATVMFRPADIPGRDVLPARYRMKRVLPVLAFLFLALPASVQAGWALVRGAGPQASFESTARPAVAVKAAPGFTDIAHGKMTVLLHDGRSLMGESNGTVWYCLSAHGDKAQLAVALADAGDRRWYPGISGSSLEGTDILYSCGSDRPETVTQRVFVRQVQLDPWMEAFKAHEAGWNASLLVSQYEWLDSDSGNKLLVEYREPLATEMCPVIIPEKLESFIKRANTSFSARFAEDGAIAASTIVPYTWDSKDISARLLSDVLGATDRQGDGT